MRTTTSIEVTTKAGGKVYADINDLVRARKLLGREAFKVKGSNKTLEAELRSAYNGTGKLFEIAIAKAFGARIVPERGGFGAIFDNIAVTDEGFETSETKAITSTVDADGFVSKARPVSVAGGSGITLRAGTRSLATGVRNIDPKSFGDDPTQISSDSLDDLLETEDVNIRPSFIKSLAENRKDQKALKNILNGKSKAAVALRKNFELKSSNIKINVQVGNKVYARSVGWTWADIYKNPKATIKITPNDDGSVSFNIGFSEALMRQALNEVETKQKQVEIKISERLAASIAEQFGALSPDLIKFLNTFEAEFITKYVQGSVGVYKGSITVKERKKQASAASNQQFISGVQWTTLVQQRLGNTMKKLGQASPPELKERSGRFRSSVAVFPNYRTRTLLYYYMPLYASLERYGYDPDEQVETSIREVARARYSKAFNIVKA